MKFNSSFTFTVFFIIFIAFGFSCKRVNSNEAKNIIFYFPEKNIYYDSRQSKYYFSLDGAKSWDSMAFKGPGYGAVLGQKISIEKTVNNVWLNNEGHRKEYNGVLLNIINKQTILISKADSIKKVKATAIIKTQPSVVEKEDPPKKGLKKFFNKIFGKKKPAEEKK